MLYDIKEDSIKLDGTSMDYAAFGSGSRTMVLIPGLSLRDVKGSGASLAYMYRKFTKDFRIYCFDRRRRVPVGFTVADIARDIAFGMDELELKNACVLGVSQGAAFGAALGIIVFGGGMITNSLSNNTVSVSNPYIVTLCAFVFGSVSSLAIIAISRMKRGVGPGGLVLAGTALSAMFGGGSTLLQYFADDTSLGAVVFWTFGNLGNVGWQDLRFLTFVFAFCSLFFLFNRWNYNAMEAGFDTATSLGVNARRLMLVSMAVCSLSAAAAVSFAGIISFVGLIAPHMMRFFVGNDHRYLIPGSAICGSLLLILADAAAKLIDPPVILPIGAIMSFIGGPVFLILLFRGRGGHD